MGSSQGAADEVKARLDIVDIISEHVALRRAGRNFKGVCPFHQEKTPSFMVNPDKQIFHCFGCGEGGDVFAFKMKYENMDFMEALRDLAKRAGVELTPQNQGERGLKEAIREILQDAVLYYEGCLPNAPRAIEYIKDRGLGEDTVRRFRLGYAPEGWHGLLNHLRGRKRYKDEWLMASGLLGAGQRGPYDMFRSRIMFPILDAQGEPIAMGGRTMVAGEEPKYLNSTDSPLFRKRDTLYALNLARDAIVKAGHALVAEGYMDVIALHQAGIASAVAPLGTALTEGHLRRIKRYAREALLVFDGDRAGIAAARRSLGLILRESMKARVLLPPGGEDPDSLIKARGREAFMELVSQAMSPVAFMLRTSAHGRGEAEAVREVLELIREAQDPLVRDDMLGELSDQTHRPEASLREALGRMRQTGGGGHKERARDQAGQDHSRQPETGQGQTRRPLLRVMTAETLLLSIAINERSMASVIRSNMEMANVKDQDIADLLQRIDMEHEPLVVASNDRQRELIHWLMFDPGYDTDETMNIIDDCANKIRLRPVLSELDLIPGIVAEHERAGRMESVRHNLERQISLLKVKHSK